MSQERELEVNAPSARSAVRGLLTGCGENVATNPVVGAHRGGRVWVFGFSSDRALSVGRPVRSRRP